VNAAARGRLIASLAEARPGGRERTLYESFERAKHTSEAASAYVRVSREEAGRFPLTGRGDVNTYALFAELFLSLINARGRLGILLPTGIATDATTAPFFTSVTKARRLVSLFDFENSAPLFQAVHRSFKFSLMTIGECSPRAAFAFFLTAPNQLSEQERIFTLDYSEIAAINPNTGTAPVFRSKADAHLVAKVYGQVPVLVNDETGLSGNPWGYPSWPCFTWQMIVNSFAQHQTYARSARSVTVSLGSGVRRPRRTVGYLCSKRKCWISIITDMRITRRGGSIEDIGFCQSCRKRSSPT